MRNNSFKCIKALTLLCITLVLVACSSAPKLAAIPAGATVLILGDSLSYGTGAAEGQDYPSLLAQHSGWDVVNAGIPGNTSAQGLARLPDLLDEHQPALLMIELGGNDFLRKIALSETEANLRAIIQAVKLKRIPTVLIAIPDYQPAKAAFGDLDDHPLYAKLAEETQTTLVSDMFSPVLSTGALKADYVHPNAAGYQVVADNLRESLEGLGLLAE
jgi:acyl-CoA thioesterase-1